MNNQEKVKQFINKYNLNNDISVRILDLVSEVGELSKEYLKSTKYGEEEFIINDKWKNELGDIFFVLINIANATGVSLDEALDSVIKKYEDRFNNSGSIGSGK